MYVGSYCGSLGGVSRMAAIKGSDNDACLSSNV